jgi:hypothetical protein
MSLRWEKASDADDVTPEGANDVIPLIPMMSSHKYRWRHPKEADDVIPQIPMTSPQICKWRHPTKTDDVISQMPMT